ncbi:MAG: hypothetical protein U0W65_11815 [Bacteroidia bacterium]
MKIITTQENRIDILQRIINKGGLYGDIANFYKNDSFKSHQFLLECSEQCHHTSLIEFFGEQLIEDIILYSEFHKGTCTVI